MCLKLDQKQSVKKDNHRSGKKDNEYPKVLGSFFFGFLS